MKIINGKELGHMPNGTVFSDIKDTDFNPNYFAGDAFINGLNIMCGHDDNTMTVESGKFNGVLHMIDSVPCDGTEVRTYNTENDVDTDYWDSITDTDYNDYGEDDYVVVFEPNEIKKLIENLQWALNGCNESDNNNDELIQLKTANKSESPTVDIFSKLTSKFNTERKTLAKYVLSKRNKPDHNSNEEFPSPSKMYEYASIKREKIIDNELLQVKKEIYDAIDRGEFYANHYRVLHKETIEKLKQIGYKVERHINCNGFVYYISWNV